MRTSGGTVEEGEMGIYFIFDMKSYTSLKQC